ncbi:tyrosine-type recombinase/integrase [Spiribacter halobius]|uniref:Integrase n=1 Tax=Sediminicurvatus halobius TaxID=2182432 RepID=A0A2U2N0C2_9GAMM|nr:site-specific integrase [Spiribacter halobius]PWG62522.1 integrase [Spiribacter halobius]UEX78617.1 site-specific integrase [Spiribacter halobius]
MTKLSEDYLKALEPPQKGRRIVFDDHKNAPRGFGVRITPSGTVSFVLRYLTKDGKDRMLTIGEWGENQWSLAAARKQGGEYRKQIDSGADILEERRALRAELTVADTVKRFYVGKRDLESFRDIRCVFEKYLLPQLGKKRIRTVRRRDIIAMIDPLVQTHPRQAGKLLGYCKQLFAWAEDREIVEASPVATLRASNMGKGLTSSKRARVLSDDELRAFWGRVDDCGMHKLTALALRMVLVTAQRPGEVAGMRWDEIKDKVWTVPASRRGKTNDEHTVPLTATAEAILEAARAEVARLSKRRHKKPSGHVFESHPGAPVSTAAMSKAVMRYAKALANQPDGPEGQWRPHDLRRTARTGLAAAGVSAEVAEAVVGHVRPGVRGVYDRHGYDHEKRVALEAWERRLLRIAEGKRAEDNVVPIMGEK